MSVLEKTPYVVVPLGAHMLELLKYNPRYVVAGIDYRCNGVFERADNDLKLDKIYSIGTEQPWPIWSILANRKYYRELAGTLQQCLYDYPTCRFILSANYTPFTRFVIDQVGVENVELWEDGLNHYIRLQSISSSYNLKELAKASAGFYRGGLFDIDYLGQQIETFDRFIHKNLNYPIVTLKPGKAYYVGQPLVEDNLISSALYQARLREYFKHKEVIYLPHPREKKANWWSDIFTVVEPSCSAETYLAREGASAVYSAFSTVNVNVQCTTNIFLARYLGLERIAKRLQDIDFTVRLV